MASDWYWPVTDEVEFGRSGAVAVGSNVMTDVFHTVGQEFAFFELEGDAVLEEDVTDTGEIGQESSEAG